MWVLVILISCVFLCIVCIQAQEKSSNFTKQPHFVLQAQGAEAVFECQYNDTGGGVVAYNWIINGRFFVGSASIRGTSSLYPGGPSSLIVTALPEYNSTTIQCEADVRRSSSNSQLFLSGFATLQVQGPLDPVTNLVFDTTLLSNTSITISWTAPFSLNLTTAEPDIQYCVDVYNVTGGEHIHSKCSIIDTSYIFPASDPDQLFDFTVTPRSNVEGSLNGTTSQLLQGSFCSSQYSPITVIDFKGAIGLTDNIIATLIYNSSRSLHMQIELLGLCGITSLTITLESSVGGYLCVLNTTTNTNMVSISSTNCAIIIRHHLYKLSIEEEYNGGSTTTEKIISTHDVQNPEVIISTSHPTHINICCTFLNNTKDLGLFVIVNSVVNFYYFHQYRGEESSTLLQLTGLGPGSYNVSVYDLESDGLPQHTPAALPLSFTVFNGDNSDSQTGGPLSASQLKLYNATSPEVGMICITCSFTSPELTGCVGIFHSVKLASTLTVLTVNHSNGMNCTNGWTEGLYSYAVFGQSGVHLEEVPAYKDSIEVSRPSTIVTQNSNNTTSKFTTPTDTSMAIIVTAVGVGALCAICLVCIVSITGILCALYKQQRKETITLDIQPNEAYSFPLKMNQNLAYETTHLGQSQAVSTEPHDYEEVDLPQASEPEYAEVMNIKNTCISTSF